MITETLVKADETASPSDAFAIVGIGASPGGLEALELIFDATPSTTGLGFVVIQHLSSKFDGRIVAEQIREVGKQSHFGVQISG